MNLRIERATVSTVRGPLKAVTENARSAWAERTGLLLKLVSSDGLVGCGEATPLPGFSVDSLEDARAALGRRPWERLPEIDLRAPLPAQIRHAVARISAEAPSARFAFETALLDLAAQHLDRPLWSLLTEDGVGRSCPVAGLISTTDLARATERAAHLVERGHRTLKVKMGRRGLRAVELTLVEAVRHTVGAEVTLRVDANLGFGDDELQTTLARLAELGVALCEEPAPLDRLFALAEVPLPVALDETLLGPDGEASLSAAGDRGILGAVVLKPTCVGGILRGLELARRARAVGAEAIVSHAFDGPIAYAAAACLAVALPEPRGAAGLARHAGLAVWPKVPLPMVSGTELVPVDVPGLGVTSSR